MKTETLNCNNFAINAALLQLAISKSGLEWHLPKEQLYGIEVQVLGKLLELEVVQSEDFSLPPLSVRMLSGIPYRIDDDLPASTILLCCDGRVVVRFENLAIPMGMHV